MASRDHVGNALQEIADDLLCATGASRCTIRRDVPGDEFFPVTEEALAPGAGSLRGERSVDLRSQPVVRELAGTGRQVVQDDCRSAYADPAFQQMLDAYGGLGAQIVTPVHAGGRLAAIVSLHQLGRPRFWTTGEIGLAATAAERVRAALEREAEG
ncbi:MAG TPA: GAF domain-containing protein [Gaiellaceae bacterium]|nr:GAF domain-containing protein [Gaiellaceae bacterium]